MSEYYTPAEVAAKLGLSEVSVRRMLKAGKILAIKPGGSWRIPKDFERHLALNPGSSAITTSQPTKS